ncbi:hypothetical protein TPADAL_0366a [Treponema pallidum subsp. pallidum DAL-1]|nr:hypothetical protein TPADAL_0366a [Treponema pallidum subsp. pallidum DAL-1]AYF91290.1 hypothetical protein CRX41_01895 [Treponema pallidum subsp. pallidum]QCU83070.1 hypothetical protein FFV11_01895 [Treponema pallidum subsp. pallidum]QFP69262.1 hypothetical protein FA889_01895 [Treponema pallidum]QFP74308.1 hypothetical protein FA890_01895 [Treponema pallidum]
MRTIQRVHLFKIEPNPFQPNQLGTTKEYRNYTAGKAPQGPEQRAEGDTTSPLAAHTQKTRTQRDGHSAREGKNLKKPSTHASGQTVRDSPQDTSALTLVRLQFAPTPFSYRAA